MQESQLYPPLKAYLEAQSYEIKGEVGPCDVVARRSSEPLLIVELKLTLNLAVVLQAVDRLKLTSSVYIGVPRKASVLKRQRKRVLQLLRRLGLGLITIDPDRGTAGVKVLLDPGDYQPRISKPRQARLLGEFEKRVGDPNLGGSDRRQGVMTAYRQRALRLACYLADSGPDKASEVARRTGEEKAREILYRDVYGWFDRVDRGVYALSPRGQRELKTWAGRADDP